MYVPEPATRLLLTLLPRVQSSIRDHICCPASRSLYTRPLKFLLFYYSSLTPRLHENASMPRYPRICFHQYHRRSTTDFECATTSCSSSHSRSSMSRFQIVLTTTLYPTARSNSVPAITTLQASISPSDCVSRGKSLIHHRPLALPRNYILSCWRLRSGCFIRTASASVECILELATRNL